MNDSEHNSEHNKVRVSAAPACPLGSVQLGFKGRISAIQSANGSDHSVNGSERPVEDLESRLIELGFVEGAAVEVLHEGLLGRDPIAVRVDGVTIALRRREAMAIIVTPAAESE
jgi:ferrous iron transport protein A